MTPMIRTLRNLLPLLSFVLNACVTDTDNPISPTLPTTPDEYPEGMTSLTINTVGIVEYNKNPGSASTRSIERTLLKENIMMEDICSDTPATRTRGADYVPTPIATLTLTEESFPSTRESSTTPLTKGRFVLLCYRYLTDGSYKCEAARLYAFMGGDLMVYKGEGGGDDIQELILPLGKYRFLGYRIEGVNVSLPKLADCQWGTKQAFGSTSTTSQSPLDLYDSGEINMMAPVSLNIIFRPSLCRMKVSIDCVEQLARAFNNLDTPPEWYENAPYLKTNEMDQGGPCQWTIGSNTIEYTPHTYVSGNADPKGAMRLNDGNLNYDYEYYTAPVSNDQLKLYYQNVEKGANYFIYIPTPVSAGKVNMIPGKSYHMTLKVNPHIVRLLKSNVDYVKNLWWTLGYIEGGRLYSEEELGSVCQTLSPSEYGSGWRLPTDTEWRGLTTYEVTDPSSPMGQTNAANPTRTIYYIRNAGLPVIGFGTDATYRSEDGTIKSGLYLPSSDEMRYYFAGLGVFYNPTITHTPVVCVKDNY